MMLLRLQVFLHVWRVLWHHLKFGDIDIRYVRYLSYSAKESYINMQELGFLVLCVRVATCYQHNRWSPNQCILSMELRSYVSKIFLNVQYTIGVCRYRYKTI